MKFRAKLKSSQKLEVKLKTILGLCHEPEFEIWESSPHWGGVKMPAGVMATQSIPNCKLIKTYFHYKIKEIYKDKTAKKKRESFKKICTCYKSQQWWHDKNWFENCFLKQNNKCRFAYMKNIINDYLNFTQINTIIKNCCIIKMT